MKHDELKNFIKEYFPELTYRVWGDKYCYSYFLNGDKIIQVHQGVMKFYKPENHKKFGFRWTTKYGTPFCYTSYRMCNLKCEEFSEILKGLYKYIEETRKEERRLILNFIM